MERTPGSTTDQAVLSGIHEHLAARNLTPDEHLIDAGYVNAACFVDSRAHHLVELIGPVPADHSWQAQESKVPDVARSRLAAVPGDLSRRHKRTKGWFTHDKRKNKVIHLRFGKYACQACPLCERCT